MTDWRSLRGSNFLTWEDLQDGPALCLITEVRGETMLNDEEKPSKEVLVVFEGKARNRQTGEVKTLAKTEWTANVVNCTLMEHLFGTPHYEQWIGHRVLLEKQACEVPGKYLGQPCVRVAGGPEIDHDIPVEIVLKMKGGKKRKPIQRVLRATRSRGSGQEAPIPPVAPEPSIPVDSNGEVRDEDLPGYGPENLDEWEAARKSERGAA